MGNWELETLLNDYLEVNKYEDYCPNGLQVEGRPNVRKILLGVTACLALIEKAKECNYDAIIVHHGILWNKNPLQVTHMLKNRLKMLLENNINLYAYHLPLDYHKVVGNNVMLAKEIGINVTGTKDLLYFGRTNEKIEVKKFKDSLQRQLNSNIELVQKEDGKDTVRHLQHVAWCCGAGQSYIETACKLRNIKIDAFITGEMSENTVHVAREYDIALYKIGHHASERYGIQALGRWLAQKTRGAEFCINYEEIQNPA